MKKSKRNKKANKSANQQPKATAIAVAEEAMAEIVKTEEEDCKYVKTQENCAIYNSETDCGNTAETDRPSPRPTGVAAGRIFIAKPASEWCMQAAERPDPVELWMSLWHEHEVACLFADTNMGKSIYATQIADAVARRGKRVLYFDFEMSDKQFQRRYTDETDGSIYPFHPGFIRVEVDPSAIGADSVPYIMAQIEREVAEQEAEVVIVDNISWLCNRAESGDAAGELMQALIALKRRQGLSVLVLAHTPKRAECSPLTQNSLAGSKRLANFMDAMFAIGRSGHVAGGAGRYIKQIKVRSSEMAYGGDNVITATLAKDGNCLKFLHDGYSPELKLLESSTENGENSNRMESIARLRSEGKTQKEIAIELRMSKRDVNRYCQQLS